MTLQERVRDELIAILAEHRHKMSDSDEPVADRILALLASPEETGETRADATDALWCMECGYRRGTSSGQTRTKCPHGHGELVKARLLTLEEFTKIGNALAVRPAEDGLREEARKQGAAEELAQILRAWNVSNTVEFEKWLRSRYAQDPRCTCGSTDGSWHVGFCPHACVILVNNL